MKAFFFIAIMFGAALYFPSSRAVVVDVTAPVLNPVLGWSTRGEMRQIARDLETRSEAMNRSFPLRQDEFVEWMEREYEGDATTDPWGQTYVLLLSRNTFTIVSPGADGELNTADDLTMEGDLRTDVRRRR